MEKYIIRWDFERKNGAKVIEVDTIEEARQLAHDSMLEDSASWVEPWSAHEAAKIESHE